MNPLLNEFESMLNEDEDYEIARAQEQIAYALEGENDHFSVTLLAVLIDWMADRYGSREEVKDIIKELL